MLDFFFFHFVFSLLPISSDEGFNIFIFDRFNRNKLLPNIIKADRDKAIDSDRLKYMDIKITTIAKRKNLTEIVLEYFSIFGLIRYDTYQIKPPAKSIICAGKNIRIIFIDTAPEKTKDKK